MARPLRIQAEGLTYHVTTRGTGGMAIYRDDTDRRSFLDVLADVADTHDLVCHAYCLMTNHYHVVTTTTRANLSGAMRQLNGCYAQRWNRRHTRAGHVFQGRFNAQIVQREGYFATVCRYVLMNPVRAGLVRAPEDWSWSSYRATVGLGPRPSFLQVDLLLGMFCQDDPAGGADRFRQFVAAVDARATRVSSCLLLGDEAFRKRFERTAAAASHEVPRRQRQVRPDLDAIFARAISRRARTTQMAQAHRRGYAMTEIASYLDLHPTTVSKAIRSARRGVRS